ncbi:MAG: DUF1700 domain-containing protein [Clostridia bacterium]|nr:DUF1700 domain-containing protein [Clostridia bacterium]
MNKQEFLIQLRRELTGLPPEDIEERHNFYEEMIDDRLEEGLTEEEAVVDIGSIDNIVNQILEDTPITKIVKERINPRKKRSALSTTLIILGFPVWASLLIALFAVILSLYVSLWAVLISLWAVFVSLAACGLAGIFSLIYGFISNSIPAGLIIFAGGLVCAGLSIFAFFGCKAATLATIKLTKKIALWTKKCFRSKEEK